jgi:hypothetical protein
MAEVVPAPGEPGGMDWPWELLLLRTQVPDGRTGSAALLQALEKTNALDVKRTRRYWDYRWPDPEGTLEEARRTLTRTLARIEEESRRTGLVYPADPSRSQIQVEDHLAQFCVNWVAPGNKYGPEEFFRWILFDDLWASAHPDLADSILRYVNRWNVLS